MQVLKFGGTSVGSVKNLKLVREIIDTPGLKIVVLSAMAGTTNKLLQIANTAKSGDIALAQYVVKRLKAEYDQVQEELFTGLTIGSQVRGDVDDIFSSIESCILTTNFTQLTINELLSKGELLSTVLFTYYLQQENVSACLLPALDFMRTDKNQEPDEFYIRENLYRVIDNSEPAHMYITQGYICRDFEGNISNLRRGGSDYTATIIGASIRATSVQIWTDIDGFHNNDPRFVKKTHAIAKLSYDEAAELAYFGAKILHPLTVEPLRAHKIPLHLKNTMDMEVEGTLITNEPQGRGIKAIAAKDGITALKIKSARMLQAHGFLSSVFRIFEHYKTAIDMITTSEIAISLTVDTTRNLAKIKAELDKFAQVTIDKEQSIICLVGNHINADQHTHHLFKILKDVDVRMISYGGSKNNISLLVATEDKNRALSLLQEYVFSEELIV